MSNDSKIEVTEVPAPSTARTPRLYNREEALAYAKLVIAGGRVAKAAAGLNFAIGTAGEYLTIEQMDKAAAHFDMLVIACILSAEEIAGYVPRPKFPEDTIPLVDPNTLV